MHLQINLYWLSLHQKLLYAHVAVSYCCNKDVQQATHLKLSDLEQLFSYLFPSLSWQGSSDLWVDWDKFIPCISHFPEVSRVPEFVLVVMEEMPKGKFNHDNAFYHSVCNMLAKILLVKASHMLSPKLRGRKLHFISSGGICKITRHRVWIQGEEHNWER